MARKPAKKENWINASWRPAAAIVYLVICICDFIIFPWIFGLRAPAAHDLALAVKDLDPQVAAVLVAPRPQWQPLTLMGSGLFHVAFGAIVGITAWTRGAAHIETLRNGPGVDDYDNMSDQNQNQFNQNQNQFNQNQFNQNQNNPNQYNQQPNSAPPGVQSNRNQTGENDQIDNPDAT